MTVHEKFVSDEQTPLHDLRSPKLATNCQKQFGTNWITSLNGMTSQRFNIGANNYGGEGLP